MANQNKDISQEVVEIEFTPKICLCLFVFVAGEENCVAQCTHKQLKPVRRQ